MKNYECSFCNILLEDPVECIKCQNNFCQMHIAYLNDKCPICNVIPFKCRKNVWLKKRIEKRDFSYKCNICEYEGDQNSFLEHLVENHKNELIEKFNSNNNNKTAQDNLEDKVKIYKKANNQNTPNQNNQNTPSQNNQSKQINQKKQNLNSKTPNDNNRNSKNKNIITKENKQIIYKTPQNYKINKVDLYYCGKFNEKIKCNCCSDHICRKGNCLCVNCMKYNFQTYKLQKGELFNKAGLKAKLTKGSYYCGCNFDTIIKNQVGQKFIKHSQCEFIQHPSYPCKDCKILNKFQDIYNAYIFT